MLQSPTHWLFEKSDISHQAILTIIKLGFYLSNGLFFFEICRLITVTVCAYKLNALALYENLFAHTVAVISLHLSKKNNSLLIFTFLKPLLHCILIFVIIINALSFMWVATNGTACWTALLLRLQVVWKEKKERAV